jgi:hypothetical protein
MCECGKHLQFKFKHYYSQHFRRSFFTKLDISHAGSATSFKVRCDRETACADIGNTSQAWNLAKKRIVVNKAPNCTLESQNPMTELPKAKERIATCIRSIVVPLMAELADAAARTNESSSTVSVCSNVPLSSRLLALVRAASSGSTKPSVLGSYAYQGRATR